MGLTLRKGNRQYFYENLDRYFPGLKERYIAEFGNDYEIPSPNNDQLMRIFKKRTRQHGILNEFGEIFEYLHEFPSKSVQSKLI
jgi:hypothetical protein